MSEVHRLGDYATPKTERGATRFSVADDQVIVSALIAGDGVDLVTHPLGRRSRTMQLSCDDARELGAALLKAADESPNL